MHMWQVTVDMGIVFDDDTRSLLKRRIVSWNGGPATREDARAASRHSFLWLLALGIEPDTKLTSINSFTSIRRVVHVQV